MTAVGNDPSGLCDGATLLRLPPELILHTSTFVAHASLSLVCRRTHELLSGWYVSLKVPTQEFPECCTHVTAFLPHTRSLALRAEHQRHLAGNTRAELRPAFLEELSMAPYLTRLTLDLRRQDLAGAMGPLEQLALCPALTDLAINLEANGLTEGDAAPLARLAESHTLQRLMLCLSLNRLGDRGCRALQILGTAPALSSLTLNLLRNSISAKGAAGFALGFQRGPNLQHLALHFGDFFSVFPLY